MQSMSPLLFFVVVVSQYPMCTCRNVVAQKYVPTVSSIHTTTQCAPSSPPGVLVSGKGTRFILANTEQLHTKIHEMSDRIRHLEDALVALQATCSPDPHPLMHPDMLGIKSTMGLYGGTQLGAEPTTPLPSTATASTEESTSLSMDVDSREARQPSEETVCAVANAQVRLFSPGNGYASHGCHS